MSQEVAESIVRFVAGGAELVNAEVEPSLLSLVCRELNNVRIAQGRKEISADLLAGSRDTILTEFYERALADQPDGVRRVIEDELLTESGYRESLAEERVAKALAAAGAAPDALSKLVNRRLLRIEERLDMRRVELTHDVLCSVVASSRDMRHEREARDEAEKQLAAQREREVATRRALVRARTIAAVCAVLMVVAAASAVFGWVSQQRARKADMLAQQARNDAEKLVGFLIEDFYEELAPTGQLKTMGKLAHMAVSYYDGLPAELMTPQTQVYRGMALLRESGALLASGDIEGGSESLKQATEVFQRLRAAGDDSEAIALGLALTYFVPYSSFGPGGGPGSKPGDLQKAADMLRPFAYSETGSRQAKLTYADILNYLSHERVSKEEAVETCEESRKLLASMGALDLSDLTAASIYADTSDSEARHAIQLGRLEQAQALEQEVYDIAEKVLAQRPGDLRSMQNRTLAVDLMGRVAARRHDYVAAEGFHRRSANAGLENVRFNPSDLNSWVYWIRGNGELADAILEQGRVQESLDLQLGTVALEGDPRRPSSLGPAMSQQWMQLAGLQARLGQQAAAQKSMHEAIRGSEESMVGVRKDSPFFALLPFVYDSWRARLQMYSGDDKGARDAAVAALAGLRQLKVPKDDIPALGFRDNTLRFLLTTQGIADIRLGRYAEAEKASQERAALPPNRFGGADPRDDISRARVMQAYSMAMQGRKDEARGLLTPEIEYLRGEQKQGARGMSFQRDLAYALCANAISQPDDATGRARRQSELAEAAKLIADLPAQARQIADVRYVGELIAAAQARPGT